VALVRLEIKQVAFAQLPDKKNEVERKPGGKSVEERPGSDEAYPDS
jgi:hypothetical protein